MRRSPPLRQTTGGEGLNCEVAWIFTEFSAILVMSTSLLRIVVFFLFKEAYFYAGWLLLTSRCAIRGPLIVALPFTNKAEACKILIVSLGKWARASFGIPMVRLERR